MLVYRRRVYFDFEHAVFFDGKHPIQDSMNVIAWIRIFVDLLIPSTLPEKMASPKRKFHRFPTIKFSGVKSVGFREG